MIRIIEALTAHMHEAGEPAGDGRLVPNYDKLVVYTRDDGTRVVVTVIQLEVVAEVIKIFWDGGMTSSDLEEFDQQTLSFYRPV